MLQAFFLPWNEKLRRLIIDRNATTLPEFGPDPPISSSQITIGLWWWRYDDAA